MKDKLIKPGSIIADSEGTLFRVLSVDGESIFMQMLKTGKDVVHTRNVSWSNFEKYGYKLKFP